MTHNHWNFTDENFDLFRSELQKIDLDNVLNTHDDVDESVEISAYISIAIMSK